MKRILLASILSISIMAFAVPQSFAQTDPWCDVTRLSTGAYVIIVHGVGDPGRIVVRGSEDELKKQAKKAGCRNADTLKFPKQ